MLHKCHVIYSVKYPQLHKTAVGFETYYMWKGALLYIILRIRNCLQYVPQNTLLKKSITHNLIMAGFTASGWQFLHYKI
jgi:hypothetical protein